MRRAGYDVRILERVIQQTGSNQTGRVRHVHHKNGAYLVCYATDTSVVPLAAVSTRAGNDEFGLMRASFELEVIVIHATRFFVEVIAYSVEHQTGEINGRTMTEVTAVTEVKTHEGIAGFEASHEHRHVRLRAAVRLHIHILRVVELLQALAGDVLGDIDNLATAVVAVTGVTLGVLVGQHAAHRFQYLVADEVLARDQFNSFGLTLPLTADDVKNLNVSVHCFSIYEFWHKGTKKIAYMQENSVFCANICTYAKFVVNLHPLLKENTKNN